MTGLIITEVLRGIQPPETRGGSMKDYVDVHNKEQLHACASLLWEQILCRVPVDLLPNVKTRFTFENENCWGQLIWEFDEKAQEVR